MAGGGPSSEDKAESGRARQVEAEDAARGGDLLIDVCCGPCALTMDMVVRLDRQGCCLLFYNPNIHPFTEYRKRLETFLAYAGSQGFGHRVLPYEPEEWIRAVAFHEEERCRACYRLRLSRAVLYAREWGFAAVSTTLFASPYQDHALLASLGGSLAAEAGLDFLVWDGRAAYRDALREARARGMYIQAWCGCLLSERERYDRSHRRGKSAGGSS